MDNHHKKSSTGNNLQCSQTSVNVMSSRPPVPPTTCLRESIFFHTILLVHTFLASWFLEICSRVPRAIRSQTNKSENHECMQFNSKTNRKQKRRQTHRPSENTAQTKTAFACETRPSLCKTLPTRGPRDCSTALCKNSANKKIYMVNR